MLDFNFMKQVETPQVILCHRNYGRYGEINGAYGLKVDMNTEAYDECSFSVPYKTDGNVCRLWDDIVDLATVLIPHFGYFLIKVSEQDDGDNKTKKVSGKSMEAELGQILLHDVHLNVLDEDITDDDYAPKKFYQPLDPKHSILHIILNGTPHWSIRHVDEALQDKQRTLSIDGTSVYDELVGEIAEQFECIFQFDVFNRVIDVFSRDTFGNDTTLFMSHENFIDNFSLEANADEIKNCLHVSGGDGIDIREVNPNGTAYIYAWGENDLNDMSDALRQKLADYGVLYTSQIEAYKAIMLQIDEKIVRIKALESDAPTDESTTDWTKYSLNYLESKQEKQKEILDVYINKGWGNASDQNYNAHYLPAYSTLVAIEAEMKRRQAQLDAVRAEYKVLFSQKEAIQSRLDLEIFLGTKLWKELSSYRREQDYTNNNFAVHDDTTDVERFELEQQLYDFAAEAVKKINHPIYDFSTTMANIYAIFEAQEKIVDKFKLGNFIRIGDSQDNVKRVRLIRVSIDFENLENITVGFSEATNISDISSTATDWMSNVKNAATSYNFIMKQFNRDKDAINYVKGVRLNGLSAALADVQNADNQEFTVGSRGIIGKEWNADKGDYEPEQIHIIKNKIVFTDDGWKSCKMAVGKVNIAGNYVYGVIADVIVGTMILGESMMVSNESNNLFFDNNGLRVSNGVSTVEINPNNNNIFQILNGNRKVMYADSSGNLSIEATITADSGRIGNVTINQNGLFGGYINADTFYSSSYSFGAGGYSTNYSKITGGNIEINGQDNYFLNSGMFYDADEGGYHDARVMIKNGTILMKGMNTYLRGMVNGRGYYNIAGISKNNNLVIGYDGRTSHGYYGGENASNMGNLGWIDTFVYGGNITLNATDGGGNVYLKGNMLLNGSPAVSSSNINSYAPNIHSENLTPYIGTGANGTFTRIGSISVATGDWVRNYCAANYMPISSSDFRLKKDFSRIPDTMVELLRKLKLYSYRFKDSTEDNGQHYGVLAQEVLSAMECLGIDTANQSIVVEYSTRPEKDEGMYTGKKAFRVNYQELSNLLLLGWQKLDERVSALENQMT